MASIPCPRGCGREIELFHDQIRALVDSGLEPEPCEKCRRSKWLTLRKKCRNKVDAVLIAMLDLEADLGQVPFNQSAIIVEAWLNEDGYSMAGFEGVYPDSHRVAMDLTKLLKTGFIAKPQPCMYALTDKGRARARLFCREAA